MIVYVKVVWVVHHCCFREVAGEGLDQAQEVASHRRSRSSFSRRPTAASTRRYRDRNCSRWDRADRWVLFEHLTLAGWVFLDMSRGRLGSVEGVTRMGEETVEGSPDTRVWEGEEGHEEHGVREPQEHSVTEKMPLSPLSYLCLVSTSAPGGLMA